MVVAPATDSQQGWVSATPDSALPAGTTVQIVDADGKMMASFVTSKQAQNIVYSSSPITSGVKYQIYTGGPASGDSVGGLSASGSLGSASSVATATAGEAPAGRGGPGRQGPLNRTEAARRITTIRRAVGPRRYPWRRDGHCGESRSLDVAR